MSPTTSRTANPAEPLDPGHQASIDRVLAGPLPEALAAVPMPAGIRSLGTEADEPQWHLSPERAEWLYGRELRLRLSSVNGSETAVVRAIVPYPLDQQARMSLPALPDGPLMVGGRPGFWIGRLRVPLTRVVPAPGLHLVGHPRVLGPNSQDDSTLFAHALLVPDVGPAVRLDVVRRRGTAAGLLPRCAPRTEPGGGLLVSGPSDDPVAALSQTASRRARHFSTATRDAVAERLAPTAGDPVGRLLDLLTRAEQEGHDAGRGLPSGVVLAHDPSAFVLQYFGEAMLRALHQGLARATGRAGSASLQILAAAAAADLTRSLRALVEEATVVEDDTNTLAATECRRTVTFFGPDGLRRPQRGRLDLRDLHPDWRGRMCPLQTPESVDIGLVRFLSMGGPGRWADVSVAASLVPYLNHDEPARSAIGAKNLRQAVPISGATAPLVRTGAEQMVAEAAGACRSPEDGLVTGVERDRIRVETRAGERWVGFGPAWPCTSTADGTWAVLVEVGDRVRVGDLLAHAPDVVLEDSVPQLALGSDCLVALLPWRGLNYEDGMVISESAASRFASMHVLRATAPVRDGWTARLTQTGRSVARGDVLARLDGPSGTRDLRSPWSGDVVGLDEENGQVVARVRVRRPLAVGDKLSNRHGGKGVVARILPDAVMPRLPDERPVELVLNPVGVLRRLNLGQIYEMNAGLAAMLSDGNPVIADRTLDDRAGLAARLQALGAPAGRIPLQDASGRAVGPEEGVLVGPQYVVKLNHLASDKAVARRDGPRSTRSLQPAQASYWSGSERIGSAQRLGEMELWALQAAGAADVLDDVLRTRGVGESDRLNGPTTRVNPSLRAVAAHLKVAGVELRLHLDDGTGTGDVRTADPRRVTSVSVRTSDLADLRELSAERCEALAAGTSQGVGRLSGAAHPLLAPELSGTRKTECEQPQWCITLPVDVPHPWGDLSGIRLPPMRIVPLLPPAFLVARDPLVHAYARLARVVLTMRADAARRARRTPDGLAADPNLVARLEEVLALLLGSPGDGPDLPGIAGRLGGKHGLLRRWLLGRSTDRSGRAVIVPDPERNPQTVGVPAWMAERIADPQPDDETGNVVVVNRQPTLHPYNLVALRMEPVSGDAVRLHPLILRAIAGDFDGDTVAVHWPVTSAARSQAWRLLRPAATLRTAASGALLAKLDLDVSLGLLLATGSAESRLTLEARLGVPVPDRLSAHTVPDLADRLVAGVPGDEAILRLAALQAAGLEAASGWGFSLLDLERVAPGVPLAEAFSDAAGTSARRLGQARDAGAAGKDSGLTQLVVSRGAVPGLNPALATRAVSGCFLTGLTDEDLFDTARGSLGKLAEKKLLTPLAGALTKSLVEIGYDVTVEPGDCGYPASLRGPLACLSRDGVCQACIDAAGGALVRTPGTRIGILAAMLVGERSTQLSMKSFHGGAAGPGVGGDVTELRALFGHGRFTLPDGSRPTLAELFAASGATAPGSQLRQACAPVLERFGTVMSGAVDPLHAEVLLRCLFLARGGWATGSVASRAEVGGRDPLARATVRGRLTELLEAVDEEPLDVTPTTRREHRLDVVLGRAR